MQKCGWSVTVEVAEQTVSGHGLDAIVATGAEGRDSHKATLMHELCAYNSSPAVCLSCSATSQHYIAFTVLYFDYFIIS